MKISTETHSVSQHVGLEKTIELLAKYGFDGWDLSFFDYFPYNWKERKLELTNSPLCGVNALSYARKLKQISQDNGIVCNQSHAPFPCNNKEVIDTLPFALEITAEAGGNICIIHPDNDKSAQENAEMYFKLLPIAKSFGVKIATENMFNWENDHAKPAACSNETSFLEHLNAVNDDYLIACLDIGHAEMDGLNTSAVKMINALGNKLQALHIHDNDRWHDQHQMPFTRNIDFVPIIKALKEINYSGYLTLEAAESLNEYNKDNIDEGVKKLANSVKKLKEMFENA